MPVYKGSTTYANNIVTIKFQTLLLFFYYYSTINLPRRPGSILKIPLIITLILKKTYIFFWVIGSKAYFHSHVNQKY